MSGSARKTALSREVLLPKLAAHVLAHGLAGLSLRPLAKAAGTSDRMLLYHFGSKDALVAELLDYLARQFAASLESAFPAGRAASRRDCFERVMAATGQPAFAPFFGLWWDIVGGCARGEQAYLASAGAIIEQLLHWIEAHLPTGDPDPEMGAKAVLTMVEGAQMLAAVGRADIGLEAAITLEG
jgi:AcrR family transcriptional regulator